MLLKSSIYLLIILIQFTSSTLNTQQKEYQKKEQQVLLNPVIRSLIRQKLNKLKKEAILLGQRNEQQNINNSDLQQVVRTESNMQYIPLNCFFSPVTCRLPIIGVKRKQRRQNLINKQQKNIKNDNKMEEREEPKVGRYFLALTYFSSPQKFLTREDNL
ncbi:unnamed protein product [Meloidogyne enterolobii]|uniref:Uncharacterized protein n=1 Tax=Meloidogyne enterolobii TaxID=390850 RepID=A0ACB0YT24_MELEN